MTRTPPPPIPLQSRLDEEAVLQEALSDEYDPESLLDIDETLSYYRPDVSQEVVKKLRHGAWIVQAQLDLHGMRREEAREALAEFVRESVKRGLRCLRVIHGKGLGSIGREPVLKVKVRAWLVQKEEVIAFSQARPHDGGASAVLVLLQPGGAPRHHNHPQDGTTDHCRDCKTAGDSPSRDDCCSYRYAGNHTDQAEIVPDVIALTRRSGGDVSVTHSRMLA